MDIEKPKVLIVDDKQENLFAMEKILGKLDINLIKVASGNEALAQTLHHDFVIILLDVQMPEMNGYEVAQYLRSDEKTKQIPIIFITAIDRDETREIEGYDAGAVDYIFKPINPKILISKVKVFIELYLNQLERKKLERYLLISDKMASIGQLAAGVAHEINNPIGYVASNIGTLNKYVNNLCNYINLLLQYINMSNKADLIKKASDQQRELDIDYVIQDCRELVQESLEGINRVKKIVVDLKTFARVDEENYEYVNINECLESTINIIWNKLRYKVALKREYGDIPQTYCCVQELNQVFMNLLVNAAEAIEKQGEIKIKTWRENSTILTAISDSGCGISQTDLNKIFNPFFTTKDVGKGTGLGLSISFDIVKKHNGEIFAESEKGKGAKFTIKIPVVDKNACIND